MVELITSVVAVLAVIAGSLWWLAMGAQEPPFASLAAPRHARKGRLPRRWRRWLIAVVDVAILATMAALVWALATGR